MEPNLGNFYSFKHDAKNSGWFQPISKKISASQSGNLPQIGVKITSPAPEIEIPYHNCSYTLPQKLGRIPKRNGNESRLPTSKTESNFRCVFAAVCFREGNWFPTLVVLVDTDHFLMCRRHVQRWFGGLVGHVSRRRTQQTSTEMVDGKYPNQFTW